MPTQRSRWRRPPGPDGKPGALLKITLTKAMPIGTFDDTIKMTTSRIPLQVEVFGQITAI